MRASSPSAYFASLTIHAVVAAIIVLLSLMIQRAQDAQKPPTIFELVAGPPTDPFAKDAPALGTPKVKLDIPQAPPRVEPKVEPKVVAEPEPDEDEPMPVVKAVEPPPEPKPKQILKKETPKPKPNELAPDAKKIVNEMNKKRMTTYLNEKRKIDRARAKEEAARKAAEAKAASAAKRIDTEGIVGGVKGGKVGQTGGGGGKALTREDMAEMDIYITGLKNRLREAHDQLKPQGLGDTLSAEVEFFIAANGEISNVRIVRPSGNAEFDASVRESFRRITYMGPRPDKQSSAYRLTFRMREDD
jgi:colicin import membrane protein